MLPSLDKLKALREHGGEVTSGWILLILLLSQEREVCAESKKTAILEISVFQNYSKGLFCDMCQNHIPL